MVTCLQPTNVLFYINDPDVSKKHTVAKTSGLFHPLCLAESHMELPVPLGGA